MHALRRTAGVSLIEALVALAVMAFGMLAVVGLQSTLRQNGDMAKQRAEAVRIAQREVELWRAYRALTHATDDVTYANLVDLDDPGEDVVGVNATYTRTRIVEEEGALGYKTLAVEVAWDDRRGERQIVRLNTAVAAVAPELAGTLTVAPLDGGVRRPMPMGRSPAIPRQALDLGDGTSALKPPGATDGVAWRFDNVTGMITLCTTTAATTPEITAGALTCADTVAVLLGGYVRYATSMAVAPTAADAMNPPGSHEPLSIVLQRTSPEPALSIGCYQDVVGDVVTYFCAVPLAGADGGWSGTLNFGPSPPVATAHDSSVATERRICKYPQTVNLVDISSGLINQNYLVIRAGNGTSKFDCPEGTSAHQPPA